jgi:hypothetical protein
MSNMLESLFSGREAKEKHQLGKREGAQDGPTSKSEWPKAVQRYCRMLSRH